MNRTLMTDFYELTMAQTYFDRNETDKVGYFDIFFRKNPFGGGYTISGGLDEIIDYINGFSFDGSDIDYLARQNCFTAPFLEYLRELKFTGDIYAVPDGTAVFPQEPVVTVRANIIEGQIAETALLAAFNHGALVTTAAKRICEAAGNIPVMEFGARRARGIESAVEASKYSFVGGCCGTSNVLAAKRYNIPALGTMAHSLICDADDEYSAFLSYAKSNPNNCVFLVDTFNVLKCGIPNAIRVARDFLLPNGYKFKGIRIDSGDLAYLSKQARKMLDDAGFPDTAICLSNSLDENTIRSLLHQGACVNSLGVGDNIAAANERVGGVYKLVAVEQQGKIIPKIKVTNDSTKTVNPGFKKLCRFYDKETGYALGDVIALADDKIPQDKFVLASHIEEWKTKELTNYTVKDLRIKVFEGGQQLYQMPDIHERKAYCEAQMKTLYPEILRSINPQEYYVDLTHRLSALRKELIKKSIR